VPLYFIRPECHIASAWVPTLGLGAVVLIRLMPRPLFESSLGTVVIYSAGCHFFLQLSADAPQAFNRIYLALVPRSFLTADAPCSLNSPDWHSLRGPFVKPSVKNWTFVENPSVKLHRLELAFEKHAESSF
jgi:hypothetical protein